MVRYVIELVSLRGGAGSDADEVVCLEARSAHQCAVDVRLAEEFAGIARLHAAAVQNPHSAGRPVIVTLGEQAAKVSMDLLGLLWSGYLARADGPNRLVGDDQIL